MTDQVCFAYLADVFVVRTWRGCGIGSRLMELVFADPRLQNMRRFLLATRDAHALYARFGFTALANPQRFMERFNTDALSRPRAGEARPIN